MKRNGLKTNKLKQNIEMPFTMPGMDDNIIMSDSHTLITKEWPSEFISASDADGNPVPGLYEQTMPLTIHKLYLNDFNDQSGHGLHKIINRLQEAETSDGLELHISGNGGAFGEGLSLYNVIDAKFKENSTAYLNYGYSMNALAFMFCKERIIFEHSEIMFHNYSTGYSGKGAEIKAYIEHTDAHMRRFNKSILSDYLSEDELERMNESKDFWMGAIEMLNRGIATGIIIQGEYLSRDEWFEKYTKKGEVKKSWLKKQKKAEQEQAALDGMVYPSMGDGLSE